MNNVGVDEEQLVKRVFLQAILCFQCWKVGQKVYFAKCALTAQTGFYQLKATRDKVLLTRSLADQLRHVCKKYVL